jgi:hypothetical protein
MNIKLLLPQQEKSTIQYSNTKLKLLKAIAAIWFNNTTYSICISSNSDGSKKLPDDGRLLQKHVGASTYNRVVQISAYCWLFLLRLTMHGTNIKLNSNCYNYKLLTMLEVCIANSYPHRI